MRRLKQPPSVRNREAPWKEVQDFFQGRSTVHESMRRLAQRLDEANINLETFIELKLAAGRFQDLADVVSVIVAHHLDDSFADRLHPSLCDHYLGCLEETRRELEFETRNG